MTILADVPISKFSVPKGFYEDESFSCFGYESPRHERHGLAPSDRDLEQLISANMLMIDPRPEESQIQPASLELRTGNEVRVVDVPLPNLDPKLLEKHTIEHRKGLSKGEEILCEVGRTYMITSFEKIGLPLHLEGITDTKSTIGRLGALCYAASGKYASLEAGFQSENPQPLLFMIEPKAFPIILKVGQTKTFQIRFREKGTSYLNPHQIRGYYGNEIGLFDNGDLIDFEKVREEDGVKLTLQTKRVFAQRLDDRIEPIDLTRVGHYNPEDYFDLLENNGEITMDPNRLYLLGSKERVVLRNISGWLTREGPYLRHGVSTHFAGFVDPGFNGQMTFEYWSFIKNLILDGQYSGRILLEDLTTDVKRSYGSKELGSSYQGQTSPRLPKVFKTEN